MKNASDEFRKLGFFQQTAIRVEVSVRVLNLSSKRFFGKSNPEGSGADFSKRKFSKVALTTAKQLQKKFKHAEDFGVTGIYNPTNARKFNRAIQGHLSAPGAKEISGAFRGSTATFHADPKTGLTVSQGKDSSFISGWKLNPQQLHHVLKDNKL